MVEEVEPEEEAGEVLLIDEIWPKKEALGLTKWYVAGHLICFVPKAIVGYDRVELMIVMIVYRYIQSIQSHYSYSISMDHSFQL